MFRTLLLGTGRFDDARRAELQAEGLELLIEEAKGTLTWRSYSGPDRYASYRKVGIFGCLAVTARRVTARVRAGEVADVPWEHPGLAGMTAGVDPGGKLVLTWDCARLHDDRRGTQELRLKTDDAAHAAAVLQAHGVPPHVAS